MEAAVDRMEAQLGRWQEYIERRAAGLAATGRVPGFESLMRLDVPDRLQFFPQSGTNWQRISGQHDPGTSGLPA